jgi:hypothetical protein
MRQRKSIEIDLEVNAAIENRRRSFGESPNAILRRVLLEEPDRRPIRSSHGADAPEPSYPGERVTGRWTVELNGVRTPAGNLKGAYRTLLLLLHARDGEFLPAFAQERARARRFVARRPEDLYLKSPGLARDHAKPLGDGWYFDTNLSTDQVSRRARIAARLVGLNYGRDVRILNNMEEI